MNWFKFNMNEYVRVKLTKRGHEVLIRNYRIADMPALNSWNPPPADAEGYHKFQLWDLMSIFGPYIGMALELCFENDLLFEDKRPEADDWQEFQVTGCPPQFPLK